ncbi:MAG TPA: response regulator transcription factor [Firmicutes bacterium]|uniref:Response regulator transcription factor n=1 Tax=Candidatus Fermentithermobacillus carboniphilus TaxID=3085328 RepID=A0AAT9LEF3_9FIRM|nr:MAG: response regulator transcription factor [Candidatus Fermentithermobacillus carboniphilus]HHW18205.1 response regulator transcription factor [Candidatus Fermentithermobacillaceae bacterium]
MKEHILVVDDERPIVKLISYHLEREGYRTTGCHDGEVACQLIREQPFDLVILDLMLPGMTGWDVLRIARNEGKKFPVIILSARGEEVDKVAGLELGADDYVTKPFSPRELVARVRAHLRRVSSMQPEDNSPRKLKYGPLVLDEDSREVFVGDQPVELTTKEFDLLSYMMKQPGRVFTRENLLSQVWGYDFEGDTRTVDVHISRVRQKIDGALGGSAETSVIETVRGVGYKLVLPAPPFDENGGSANRGE